MLHYQQVDLTILSREGRNFEWDPPRACPRCGSCRLWGHGYVARLFEGFSKALQIKRLLCVDCGCVIQMRPEGFWRKCQTAGENIFQSLEVRLKTGRWPPGVTRQRAGHWLGWLNRWLRERGGEGFPSMVDAVVFCRIQNVSLAG